ncbi:hypothetical protein Ga0061079_10240 [Apibacter mensalis]|uniref:Uncharacterized protein n=1 Tax=Apibacter mensalis TaxID=1586267 RepID=A0A0X3AN54_9FLAO|nr:hypothetical protein [Apibacter mensalis]CVK15495.1 hypothetical protein Ga0061079_10240 [Apibacter mensalis]
MNLMTKTNGKYTYDDFLLRKRVLKNEIFDMENKLSLEHLPKALGLISDNVRDKALHLVNSPSLLNLLINFAIGFGTEKMVSKFVNKKTLSGKLILLASSYITPMLLSKGKNVLSNIRNKNQAKALNNFTE